MQDSERENCICPILLEYLGGEGVQLNAGTAIGNAKQTVYKD